MKKIITTYRIEADVKKEFKVLVASEEVGNASDMLKKLIKFYKDNNKTEEDKINE